MKKISNLIPILIIGMVVGLATITTPLRVFAQPDQRDVSATTDMTVTLHKVHGSIIAMGKNFIPGERIIVLVPTSGIRSPLFVLYADKNGKFREDVTYTPNVDNQIRYVFLSNESGSTIDITIDVK